MTLLSHKKEVIIEEVGTTVGYEHYHNEYYLDDELIGHSSWDKNQRGDQGLHVGGFELTTEYRRLHPKNFYAETPQGIAYQMSLVVNNTSQTNPNDPTTQS